MTRKSTSGAFRTGMLSSETRPIDIAFLFRVRSDEALIGEFQSVDGLHRTFEPFEYKEGGRNSSPHMLYGPGTLGRLVLRSGVMTSSYLYDWIHSVEMGKKFRRDLIISQCNRRVQSLRVFTVERAWPVEWKAPKLDALQSEIPVDELTLVYQELRLEVNADVDAQ